MCTSSKLAGRAKPAQNRFSKFVVVGRAPPIKTVGTIHISNCYRLTNYGGHKSPGLLT